MKRCLFAILLMLFNSCASTREIIDKPIIFDEERAALTLQYMADRYGLERDTPEIDPKIIVLHWTVIPTFEGSFDVFNDPKIAGWREYVQTISGLNVSAHFLVDRDGTIFRLMPEITMARHVIGLNHCAIGIENVGGTDDLPLTRAQLKANIWLVEYLKSKYNIEYLIGHYEYTQFVGHELWLEKDKNYRTEKTDPGIDFMKKVRKATKNLNFEPLPENSATYEE
ncbi:MAG: peptidoglycan recognition protein family protein [Eudoraea sp.]|nr:peptidoglycan recognition protein family protein [Eudoraea sp.]